MAEHSYAWYTIGSEQIWPRIGGADDDPDWFYWTFGFEYDGDSYAVYERAEKVYDLDNQLYSGKAIKWGLAIENLQDCLTRLKAVETALEESWDGAASLRMQEIVRQAQERLTHVLEILEPPTAFCGYFGKSLKEFQAGHRKIPITTTYYPKYGEYKYTYGVGTTPLSNLNDDKNMYSSSSEHITKI